MILAAVVMLVAAAGGAPPASGQSLAPLPAAHTPAPPLVEPLFSTPPLPDRVAREISLVWRNRPRIRIGDDVRIDLRARIQSDWRTFEPDIGEDTYAFQAARVGIAAEIADDVEFQVEYDAQNDRHPWRDVYGEWKTYRQFAVRGGRFKMPFGLEQNTPYFEVDFAYRTLGSSVITPNRDLGGMVSGRFLKRALTYDVGVFRHDGDNGELEQRRVATPGEPLDRHGPSVAGRVTALPMRWATTTLFDTFRVGIAGTASNLPEGLHGLHSDGRLGGRRFFDPVYVKGTRRRLGTELAWTPGPVGVRAEWMRAIDSRDGQGFADVDLPALRSTAWYVSATWVLTGEAKAGGGLHPARPLFQGGWGAVELGARYERLRFDSAVDHGVLERNPRGSRLLPNEDRAWTLGGNWYVNRWVRVLVNAIHERFTDALRTPAPPAQGFWAGVFRLQLVL